MRILRTTGIVLVVLVGLIVLLAFAARFNDGPLGIFPGGALQAGELHTEPVADWAFAADQETIELQLASQERSRTTWILVREGASYVPCSLGFPPGKSWHQLAERDGRAILRIRGKRYPVLLERVDEAELARALTELVQTKYSGGPPGDSGTWFFRVSSRTP